jgi:Mrp family chromosome partitioning ATPase
MTTTLNKTEELYKSLYQRASEQKLSESLSAPDEVIYDAAVPPDRPSKPQRGLLIVMVTLMALALYIMYLIVGTAMDKTVNSLSELKAKAALDASGEFPQLPNVESAKQIFHNVQYADMIHSLRLALLNRRDKPATILVTSVQPRFGSSLIAELLASSASKARKTLLIDLDYLASKGLSAKYPQQKLGFSQLLNGTATAEQAIVKLDDQLDFLARGELNDSSLLLLTSERLPALLATLHQTYDTLVIDTPALSLAQDSLLLAAQSDINLLVVKAGEQAARVREAELRLKRAGDAPVALLLNQVKEENLETQEGNVCSIVKCTNLFHRNSDYESHQEHFIHRQFVSAFAADRRFFGLAYLASLRDGGGRPLRDDLQQCADRRAGVYVCLPVANPRQEDHQLGQNVVFCVLQSLVMAIPGR